MDDYAVANNQWLVEQIKQLTKRHDDGLITDYEMITKILNLALTVEKPKVTAHTN